ncbi:MAG: hypothetical protein AAFY01_03275 [Pseudomonadota bacterium]
MARSLIPLESRGKSDRKLSRRLMGPALIAGICLAPVPALAAAQCDLPGTTLRGEEATEVSQAFKDFVKGNLVGKAQDRYAQSVIENFTAQAAATEDLVEGITFSIKADMVTAANNWVHVLKANTVAQAVINQDAKAITDFARDETVELGLAKFLEYMGAAGNSSVPGAVMLGLANLKESYEELEVKDCLLRIDVGYYNFLEDPDLRHGEDGKLTSKQIDTYIQHYLRGGGDDPKGNPRELNRRNLQCFINNTMPEGERVEVSTLGADAEEPTTGWNFFGRTFGGVTDALRSAGDAAPGDTRIRTPVLIMLQDFNNRYDAELERRKLIRLKQSAEFAIFEDTANAMKVTEQAAQWLCDRLKSDKLGDVAGAWEMVLTLQGIDGLGELPPLPFDLPENGLVLTEVKDGRDRMVVEGKVSNGRAALDLLQRAWDDDLKSVETVFNLDLDGTHEGETMSGNFDGTSVDWGCVFEDMFDDDAPPRRCPQVPVKGTWTAAKK